MSSVQPVPSQPIRKLNKCCLKVVNEPSTYFAGNLMPQPNLKVNKSSVKHYCDPIIPVNSNKITVPPSTDISPVQSAHQETASDFRTSRNVFWPKKSKLKKNLKTIKRIPKPISKTLMPTIINLNPRSLYGRAKELEILINEYQGDAGVYYHNQSFFLPLHPFKFSAPLHL